MNEGSTEIVAIRNIESTTDSELSQRVSATQPYNVVEIVITTANPARQRDDGSTEYSDPTVESNQSLVPGRELQESMARYNRLVEQFKKDNPEFDAIVGQNIPISVAVRDEILRAPNGPAIATFLGSVREVAARLFDMHPLDAAECIRNISEDLESCSEPTDDINFGTWRDVRNHQLRRKRGL